MRKLRSFLVLLAIVLIIFVAIGLFLPANYSIQRTVSINAPIAEVFAKVSQIEQHEVWSPWKIQDSSVEFIYGDRKEGAGAFYQWQGERSGAGKLTIVEVVPPHYLKAEIDFQESGKGTSYWTFESRQNNETVVNWVFEGEAHGVIQRYLSLIMDRLLGSAFEKALARLKEASESSAVNLPKSSDSIEPTAN